MVQLKRFTLNNGTRVLVVPNSQSPSVTAAVLVQAGTAYESKSINGLSHFLEHMYFKGTQRRPRAIDISTEFESLGAVYNAFTSRDLTGYYAKVAWPNTEKIMDLISDMYLNPLFSSGEIEKEKGVIIEEINMYEDQPQAKVGQLIERVMYGNQPAGWAVSGTKENIRKMKRDDFIDYREKHYIGSKTIIILAGNITFKKAKVLAEKYFNSVKKGKIIKSSRVTDIQKSPKIDSLYKELDQSHLILAFKAFPATSQKRFALGVMADVLGGGMSSRLFQKVREELGAAYYIGASTNLYATHGYLEISAGVNHSKVYQATEAIIDQLRDVAKNGITSRELAHVKEHRIGTFMLSLETSSDMAFYYGEQEAENSRILSPSQAILKLKSVTKGQVARLAKEILQNNRLNFSIIGPYRSADKFKKILYL
jgi:predicted Zn-dependent peptidase